MVSRCARSLNPPGLLFLLAVAGPASPLGAQTDPADIAAAPPWQELAAQAGSLIRHELQARDIPALSIALIDGDEIVWAEGFGWARPDDKTPATAATLYRVGSVSKLLNDMAVMQQVQRGKLDLDADIRQVLPGFAPENPFDQPVTLRQLMNHQSGLVREPPVGHYFDDSEPSLEDTVTSLNRTRLVHPPDSRAKYSNAAVAVAGYAVEVATGTPFAEHIRRELLEPLGMHHSAFVADDRIRENLAEAVMWSVDGRRFPAPVFELGTLPAGNLYSSVLDLGNFMRTIFNRGQVDGRRVLDAGLLDQMLVPQTGPDGQQRSYGIGFRMSQLDGQRVFEHGGAVYGYATQFRGLPDQQLGVVVVASLDVANGLASNVANLVLRNALAIREGKSFHWPEPTVPMETETARRLAGLYIDDAGNRRRLYESGGRLMMSGGTLTREIRRHGEQMLIDDVHGSGPTVVFDEEGFTLGDSARWQRREDPLPGKVPGDLAGFVGQYGWPHNVMFVYEREGQLWCLIEWVFHYPLTRVSGDTFAFPDYGLYHQEFLEFYRDGEDAVQGVIAAQVDFPRRQAGPGTGQTFRIQPLLPAHRLREIAMAESPPPESGDFLAADLVDLATLEPGIHYDIRYASDNNFMGMEFYRQPRAFLQRPAAEAVVRAHHRLVKAGYGLLIHDAYRPWYVTKMFWEATPPEMKHFVANPDNGSRHNRGCAVDLTLYELDTGEVVPMVAGYDEFSERSYPDYPGGTARQRWHRRLLRDAMESEGFAIYEYEWWHFDHSQWQMYPLGNRTFEEIDP